MYYLVIVALCRAMSRLCVIWHPLWPFLESLERRVELVLCSSRLLSSKHVHHSTLTLQPYFLHLFAIL